MRTDQIAAYQREQALAMFTDEDRRIVREIAEANPIRSREIIFEMSLRALKGRCNPDSLSWYIAELRPNRGTKP